MPGLVVTPSLVSWFTITDVTGNLYYLQLNTDRYPPQKILYIKGPIIFKWSLGKNKRLFQ